MYPKIHMCMCQCVHTYSVRRRSGACYHCMALTNRPGPCMWPVVPRPNKCEARRKHFRWSIVDGGRRMSAGLC